MLCNVTLRQMGTWGITCYRYTKSILHSFEKHFIPQAQYYKYTKGVSVKWNSYNFKVCAFLKQSTNSMLKVAIFPRKSQMKYLKFWKRVYKLTKILTSLFFLIFLSWHTKQSCQLLPVVACKKCERNTDVSLLQPKLLLQKFIELDLANKIMLWCQTQ